MFQFIKALCKQTARPARRQHRRAQLKFESLETREALAFNVWAAVDVPPQAPTEQVSIIFPVFQKVELNKYIEPTIKPVGIISPNIKPLGYIEPTFKPVGYINPNLKPVEYTSPQLKPVGYVTPAFPPVGYPYPNC